MNDLNLNEKFVPVSDKVSALLDSVIVDKDGNVFIDPDLISRSESKVGGYVDVYLENVLEEVRSLLSGYEGDPDAEMVLQYMEAIVSLHDRLSGVLNGEEELTAYGDLTSFSDLTSAWGPFELEKKESGDLATRGDPAEDLAEAYRKAILGKIRGAGDFAKKFLEALKALLEKEKSLLDDLGARYVGDGQDNDWIFPDEQPKYDARIDEIDKLFVRLLALANTLRDNDLETMGLIELACEHELEGDDRIDALDDLGWTTKERLQYALVLTGVLIVAATVLFASLRFGPDSWIAKWNPNPIGKMSFSELRSVMEEIALEGRSPDVLNKLMSAAEDGKTEIEDLYRRLCKEWIHLNFDIDPWGVGEDSLLEFNVKTMRGWKGLATGKNGDVWEFIEWKTPERFPSFGESCYIEGRFRGRLRCDLYKQDYAGGDEVKFKRIYGDWVDPDPGETYPRLDINSLYSTLDDMSPRGYVLESYQFVGQSAYECEAVYMKKKIEEVWAGASLRLIWADDEKPNEWLNWSIDGTMTTTYNEDGSVALQKIRIPNTGWEGTRKQFEDQFDTHTFALPWEQVEDPIYDEESGVELYSGAYWAGADGEEVENDSEAKWTVMTKIYIDGKPIVNPSDQKIELKYHSEIIDDD